VNQSIAKGRLLAAAEHAREYCNMNLNSWFKINGRWLTSEFLNILWVATECRLLIGTSVWNTIACLCLQRRTTLQVELSPSLETVIPIW